MEQAGESSTGNADVQLSRLAASTLETGFAWNLERSRKSFKRWALVSK